MCLIVSKPEGVKFPKDKDLKRWFKDHDDGFGMMFNDLDNVHILKGAMNVKDMFRVIDTARKYIKPKSLSQVNAVLHFRQATEGSVCPGNCHPFPITDDDTLYSELDLLTDVAIAHNGIIWDYCSYTNKTWTFDSDSPLTDTQKFILDYLVDIGKAITNKGVKSLIAEHTDSRFALLTSKGIHHIGNFVKDKGLFYSNGGYKMSIPTPAKIVQIPETNIYSYGRYSDGYQVKHYSKCERCDVCEGWRYDVELVGDLMLCNPCAERWYTDTEDGAKLKEELLTMSEEGGYNEI